MDLTEHEAQAVHEAGHAVVAHFRGFRIQAIRWVSTGARIEFEERFANPQGEQDAEGALLVHVAGYAAQRKARVLDRLLVSEYLRDHASRLDLGSDPIRAVLLIGEVFESRGEPRPSMPRVLECVEAAERCSFSILDEHWPAVEALASTMLRAENLPGVEVHRIIEATCSRPTPQAT
jgi:hypothetical protein